MSDLSNSGSSGLSEGWAVVTTQGELEGSDAGSSSSSFEVIEQKTESEPEETVNPHDPASQGASMESTELEELMKKADAAAVAVKGGEEKEIAGVSDVVAKDTTTSAGDAADPCCPLPSSAFKGQPPGGANVKEWRGKEDAATKTTSLQPSPETASTRNGGCYTDRAFGGYHTDGAFGGYHTDIAFGGCHTDKAFQTELACDEDRAFQTDQACDEDRAFQADQASQTDQACQTDSASPVLSHRRLSLSSLWSFSSRSSGEGAGSSDLDSDASSDTESGEHTSPGGTETDTEPEFVCLESEASSSCAQSTESSMSRSGVKGKMASRSSVGSEFKFLSGSEGFTQSSVRTDLNSLPATSSEPATQRLHHHQQGQSYQPQTSISPIVSSTKELQPPSHPPVEQAFSVGEDQGESQEAESLMSQDLGPEEIGQLAPGFGDRAFPYQRPACRRSLSSSEREDKDCTISPQRDDHRQQGLMEQHTTPAVVMTPRHVDHHVSLYMRRWHWHCLVLGALLMLLLAFGLGHWLGMMWGQSKQLETQLEQMEELRSMRDDHRHCVSQHHHFQQQADAALQRERRGHQETVTKLEDRHQRLAERLKEAEWQVEQLSTLKNHNPHHPAEEAARNREQPPQKTISSCRGRRSGRKKTGSPSHDPAFLTPNLHDQENAELLHHLYFSLRDEREVTMNTSSYLNYITRSMNMSALLHYLANYWDTSLNWVESLADASWLSGFSQVQKGMMQSLPSIWKEVSSSLFHTYNALVNTMGCSSQGRYRTYTKGGKESRGGWKEDNGDQTQGEHDEEMYSEVEDDSEVNGIYSVVEDEDKVNEMYSGGEDNDEMNEMYSEIEDDDEMYSEGEDDDEMNERHSEVEDDDMNEMYYGTEDDSEVNERYSEFEDDGINEKYFEVEGNFKVMSEDDNDWKVEREETTGKINPDNFEWTVDENEEQMKASSSDPTKEESDENSETEDRTYRGKKYRKKLSNFVNKLMKKTQKSLSRVGKRLQKAWYKVKDTSWQLWSDNSAISRIAARVKSSVDKLSLKIQKKAQRWFKKHMKHSEHHKEGKHRNGERNMKKSEKQDTRRQHASSDKPGKSGKKNQRKSENLSEQRNKKHRSDKHGNDKHTSDMNREEQGHEIPTQDTKVKKTRHSDNMVENKTKDKSENLGKGGKEKEKSADNGRNGENKKSTDKMDENKEKEQKLSKLSKDKKEEKARKSERKDKKRKSNSLMNGDSETGAIYNDTKERSDKLGQNKEKEVRSETPEKARKERSEIPEKTMKERSDKPANAGKKGEESDNISSWETAPMENQLEQPENSNKNQFQAQLMKEPQHTEKYFSKMPDHPTTPTHHSTLSDKNISRIKYRLQSLFQELFSKVGSMDRKAFKDLSSRDVSSMVEDIQTVGKQYDHHLDLGLPISGSQWLECQHAFWVSATSFHVHYEPGKNCFRFLASWQVVLIEEKHESQTSATIQKNKVFVDSDEEGWNSLKLKGNNQNDADDSLGNENDIADDFHVHSEGHSNDGLVSNSDDKTQQDQLFPKGQREEEATHTPRKPANSEGAQEPSEQADQSWYIHRTEGRSSLRSEDHKADWVFERANERDEIRQQQHEADWVFERAADRDASRLQRERYNHYRRKQNP